MVDFAKIDSKLLREVKFLIESLMKKIEGFISANIPNEGKKYFDNYKNIGGASDEEIQAFENEFDIVLPNDFKELYKYKNGSAYPFNIFNTTYNKDCVSSFFLLSLDEIRKDKRFFNENKPMTDDDFFSSEDIAKLDKRIKPFINNERWIPFAQLANGSLYLLLDFDPSETGTIGQIIIYVHDPDFIYYVSKDINGLLQDTISSLEFDDWRCEDFYLY